MPYAGAMAILDKKRMTTSAAGGKEGGLEQPTRHEIDWKNPSFYDPGELNKELARVFDICHGCRRCVNLCNAFPTLFDLIDEAPTLEVDSVDPNDYSKVAAHCYLCDMCYMSKCPYVPPHEWAVDFPKLMLRAKAVAFQQGQVKSRDKWLTSTDAVGKFAGIPIIHQTINAALAAKPVRAQLDKYFGIHRRARLPDYAPLAERRKLRRAAAAKASVAGDRTTGKVALFATCYSRHHAPEEALDLRAVFEHNGIVVAPVTGEQCCGMPKLELGDLRAVEKLKQANAATLLKLLDNGFDIVAPVPSCVLMFKQELPLMFPDDGDVRRIRRHIFDPAEYLLLRHDEGLLNTDFKRSLGKVAYHAACHTRVQNIGLKMRALIAMVPDTQVTVVERCSGHDGTYAVKSECYDTAVKIARPAARQADNSEADYFTGDCALARQHIASLMNKQTVTTSPMLLLKKAYGI